MTATVTTVRPAATTSTSTGTRRAAVLRAAALSTVLAAVATEVFTAIVRAAGLHLAVGNIGGTSADVVEIGPGACTIMVALCAVAGLALAGVLNRWAKRPAHTYRVSAVALTVASFVPDVFASATATSSKLTLITAHVIAAAIVIPMVSRSLKTQR